MRASEAVIVSDDGKSLTSESVEVRGHSALSIDVARSRYKIVEKVRA